MLPSRSVTTQEKKRILLNSIYGVDIDPQALLATQENAARNAVSLVTLKPEDLPKILQADIIIANILANPLRVLAPLLAAHTKPGGSLVLAGILDPQTNEIIGIYREWFDLVVWKSEEGWSCIAGRRHLA